MSDPTAEGGRMALYGDNLGSGIAGFGDTPDEAARAFGEAFLAEGTPEARVVDHEEPEQRFG